jgi:hypothetical protein
VLKSLGHYRAKVELIKVELIMYADDFVRLCRKITSKLASFVTEKTEQWLGLKINRDKTHMSEVRARESGLGFLGYNFRLASAPYGSQRRYWRNGAKQEAGTTGKSVRTRNDLQ